MVIDHPQRATSTGIGRKVRSGGLVVLMCVLMTGCAGSRYASGRRDASNCAWRVCVSWEDTPAGRIYRAVNAEPVPVTVVLTFRALENLRPPSDVPVVSVIPPDSSVQVRLDAIVPGRSISAGVAISIDLGASTTEADEDYVYAVPFGGSAARQLTQGFDGPSTHMGSMRYSLDFTMPRGTPVLAARPGTVLYLQDGFTQGGADPALLEQANLVVIAHRDGTMASYGHLEPGIAVSVGDTVATGDVLGLSGRTGFAGRPHLHFHVGLRMLGEPGRTIPIELGDHGGRPIDLAVGTMVEPGRRSP